MCAHIFRCSVARRPRCSLCIPTRAYYSQSALSFAAARVQEPGASASAGPSGRTQTTTWTNCHQAAANTRNPLDPTRLDRYLASIRAADLEPTLDDVERCKPESFSRPESSRYAVEYTNLLETLCRSFSKDQLRRFTELYKLDPIWIRSSRRKTEYAESIIEKAWGWPSLKEIERKRRDTTEMLVKSFAVTPSQLFLIMGKDGADLLQLSMQYNVHISLTSSPLALRVEGLRGSLKELTEYISSFKKGIIDEIFELPTGRPVRPDLLQRISRLAGAYVENHGNRGKIRTCAKDPSDIFTAEQLALRASLEVGTQARTVCYDPPIKTTDSPVEIAESPRYSIYPFVTPYPFPWTMHSGGAFRLRRVADWLGIDSYEDITSTGGLAGNSHRLLNLNRSGEELGQLVCSNIPESTLYRRRMITASFGHILISSIDNSQRVSIYPPTRDALSLPDILKQVETCAAPLTFVPSTPPSMLTYPVDKRRVLHRLVYRTLPQLASQASEPPQHVLRFEMGPLGPTYINAQATPDPENSLKLNDTLFSDELNSSQGTTSQADSLPKALTDRWHSSCQVGVETCVNLMLPDRPMDVQLCIFDWNGITLMQQPQVLQDYAGKLHDFLTNKAHLSQPNPPSTLSYEGRTYYLHDSLNSRFSNYPNLSSIISNDRHVDDLVEACSESVVDLQSSQKTELCQVKFHGSTEGSSWKRFLATCDQLSVMSLESRRKDKPQTVYLEE